jgi:hypothetical protein
VRVAGGEADEHEASAADVAGLRMNDGEDESGGDGGVDGVAAALHRVNAGLRGELVDARDHGVRRALRAERGLGVGKCGE